MNNLVGSGTSKEEMILWNVEPVIANAAGLVALNVLYNAIVPKVNCAIVGFLKKGSRNVPIVSSDVLSRSWILVKRDGVAFFKKGVIGYNNY